MTPCPNAKLVIVLWLAAGDVGQLISDERSRFPAGAQPEVKPPASRPAAAKPNPTGAAAGQNLPPEEIKAGQDLARALHLAQSGRNDAEAISAAREALKAHVKPAPGKPDDLTIRALSLVADLHRRTGELAGEAQALATRIAPQRSPGPVADQR